MEREFVHSTEGQEVQEDDINLVAQDAALADDRVLAELFRLKPFDSVTMPNVTKSILAYSEGPTVSANGASGSVRIYPFRPLVASAGLASSDAKENWRDIRSTVYIGNPTGNYLVQSLTANASSDPRWDLIYVRVDKDANETPVSRYVASISGETSSSISVVKSTTAVVGVVLGTTAASPTLPALPTDSGDTFYVPLAYILVPAGFGATTIVQTSWIFEACPVIPLSKVTGACTARPASANNTVGGAVLSSTVTEDWGSSQTRPEVFLPPSMTGEEVLYFAVNMQDATSSNWSQLHTSVVDDTKDWRYRLFHWVAQVDSDPTHKFAWYQSSVGGAVLPVGNIGQTSNSTSSTMAFGVGQTMVADSSTVAYVATLDHNNVGGAMSSPNSLQLYVDMTDGKLRVAASTPGIRAYFRICASTPFGNK